MIASHLQATKDIKKYCDAQQNTLQARGSNGDPIQVLVKGLQQIGMQVLWSDVADP